MVNQLHYFKLDNDGDDQGGLANITILKFKCFTSHLPFLYYSKRMLFSRNYMQLDLITVYTIVHVILKDDSKIKLPVTIK